VLVFFSFAAILYFGWTYIEAILILLPLPDPSDMSEKAASFVAFLKSKLPGQGEKKDDYLQGFGSAP